VTSGGFLRTTDFNRTFDTRLGQLFGTGSQAQMTGAGGAGVECFLGDISLTALDYPPPGRMFAAGQTLLISQNSALFSLLGSTYGGNGTSTFQVPDPAQAVTGRHHVHPLYRRRLSSPLVTDRRQA
jgi:hypothetical protein